MKPKKETKTIKLWNSSIEIPKEIQPIRVNGNRRLTIVDDKLYSYDTEVAMIDWESKTIFVKESAFFWSATTTRQIQKVTHQFKLTMFGNRPNRTIHKGELAFCGFN